MRTVAVMAKYWERGQVKTRLARAIGPRAAQQIYRSLLKTLLARLAAAGDRRLVFYTPAERAASFAELAGPSWQLAPQVEGDLGRRMQAALAWLLELPAEEGGSSPRVVLLGADSPSLPLERLEQAWQLLAQHDAVLGPSFDGGYYLVGAARSVPPIFDGPTWGTDSVWRQTEALLAAHRTRYATLAPWFDVDERDDLDRLLADLDERAADEPLLGSLAEQVRQALAQS